MTTVSMTAAPARSAAARPAAARDSLFDTLLYRTGQVIGRLIWILSIRTHVIGEGNLRRTGPLILASTHLSHLEPFLLSTRIWRRIDWMTRVEFFRHRPIAAFLRHVGAFPVIRTGVPVSAVRAALARLADGKQIGICPEGGVATGTASACRGGFIRRGVGLLAYRTGAPVVPVVLIGTHKLNAVKPYLPFRRAKLWIAFGEPVYADRNLNRRAAREELSTRLLQQYMSLYQTLLCKFDLSDNETP